MKILHLIKSRDKATDAVKLQCGSFVGIPTHREQYEHVTIDGELFFAVDPTDTTHGTNCGRCRHAVSTKQYFSKRKAAQSNKANSRWTIDHE